MQISLKQPGNLLLYFQTTTLSLIMTHLVNRLFTINKNIISDKTHINFLFNVHYSFVTFLLVVFKCDIVLHSFPWMSNLSAVIIVNLKK